jgi:D-glycero-D-manno-heptose 1,7-bisphosphate phosphatase
MARLILLDRDGVINVDSPDYVKSPDEWRPIPGSLQAIATLRASGFKVGVCTNQAGVARGHLTRTDLEAIHAKMCDALGELNAQFDGVAYCPHHPDAGCRCRKPQPGMLLTMMRRLKVPARDTMFVGDSLRDVQAAIAAGCRAVVVRTGNGVQTETQARDQGLTVDTFEDLASFAQHLTR